MFEGAVTRSNQSRGEEPRALEVATLPHFAARLYRAAYALCRSRENAEDLVQETYARVLRRPRMLRQGDEMTYLLRVLRNTWISAYRASSARPPTDGAVEIELFADPHGNAAERALELKLIYTAIGKLPDPLRETIAAVDIAGLSYKEAARALGTKPGTIMSRLYRAREQVAAQIQAVPTAAR